MFSLRTYSKSSRHAEQSILSADASRERSERIGAKMSPLLSQRWTKCVLILRQARKKRTAAARVQGKVRVSAVAHVCEG